MKKNVLVFVAFALVLALVGFASAQTSTTSGTLMCIPQTQTTTMGQDVFFSATGGNGTYTWSVPEITLANPVGTGLRMNYGTSGLHVVTVTSGGQSSQCLVTVLAATSPTTPTYPTLPNTGEGGDVAGNLIWLLVGLGIISGVALLAYRGLVENR